MNVFFGVVLLLWTASAESSNIIITASWRDSKFTVLDHFWRNTGFSPLGVDSTARKDYLLSYDERVNLALIGSIPNSGITHLRIHWILDLVQVREIGLDGPIFNFQHLDELVDWLHRHGLFLNFELMGNPSGYFHDFQLQSDDWHNLIKQILSRYIDMYGAYYVYNWRFELLNEPDLKLYNSYNFTLQQYLQYFRATERALGRILGPAGLFRDNRTSHPLCWGLLEYCNLNPCHLKTVTFHRKGDGVASKIVRHGMDLIADIKSKFPNLTVSYGNSEADIMTGWQKPLKWRADVRYASLVLRVILDHIQEMRVRRNIPMEMLSNDNAFINYHPHYFTQRTLFARFQMNNTKPAHVQFFRKPVYTVMGLLSMVGKYVLDIRANTGQNGASYLLTAEKYRSNFLATITDDKASESEFGANETSTNLSIKINLEKSDDYRVAVVYAMDNAFNSPYRVWVEGGSPDFPDEALRRKMRLSENLRRLHFKKLDVLERKVSVALPNSLNPTIVSINVCSFKYRAPGPVDDVHYERVNAKEIILFWSDRFVNSKCLLTYVVEFRASKSEAFERINEDSIFLSYHYDGSIRGVERGITGEYRIAAVDYFKRRGNFSTTIEIFPLDGASRP